ncbi:cation transporter [Candidatus Sumerlaeota bacterium]|nr:cation transporter [Candidatus Sumerlaeota bacterium]
MTVQRLKIEGMTCNSCANRVTKILKEIPGVSDAKVSLSDGMAEVATTGAIDPIVLTTAVEKKGYRATPAA